MPVTKHPEHSPRGTTSDDTATFQGRRITVSLDDADGGTEITMLYEHIPRGIRPEDNQRSSQSFLEKLATLLEANGQDSPCHPHQGIRGDGSSPVAEL